MDVWYPIQVKEKDKAGEGGTDGVALLLSSVLARCQFRSHHR